MTDQPASVNLGEGEASSGGVGVTIGDDGTAVVTPTEPGVSITGTKIDPVDGQPIFGELDGQPMSRQRYLDAVKVQAKDDLVAELRQPVPEDGNGDS